jgi:hypothetical protein
MRQTSAGDPCPLNSGQPCRHCSDEFIRDTQRVGVIATGRIEIRKTSVHLGERCNNDGRLMVKDLRECPIPAALQVPLQPLPEPSELEWMRRRSA